MESAWVVLESPFVDVPCELYSCLEFIRQYNCKQFIDNNLNKLEVIFFYFTCIVYRIAATNLWTHCKHNGGGHWGRLVHDASQVSR